jgi:hypothetical protein
LKTIQPYKHDCARCVWVGWTSKNDQLGNMYICEKNPRFFEILIRWSDDPSDYSCYSAHLDSNSKPHSIGVLGED